MNPGEDVNASSKGNMKIDSRTDVVDVRSKIRELCDQCGFSLPETTRVVTATSELSRNIVEFAGTGQVTWKIREGNRPGIELIFEDEGPGIEDVEWATRDGTSTGNGLGKGLPGAEKLMDEMKIETEVGSGTRITIKKWSNHRTNR